GSGPRTLCHRPLMESDHSRVPDSQDGSAQRLISSGPFRGRLRLRVKGFPLDVPPGQGAPSFHGCVPLLAVRRSRCGPARPRLPPASVTGQWRREMESQFDLPFAVLRSLGDWEDRPYLIASIDLAKRGPHRSAAQSRPWDLVIVDEAHRLKNRLSVNWRFVAGLSKKYMLLLTATPVQNDMEELFNLVSVLKPGALRTYEGFIDRYVGSRDRRVPAN